MFIVDSKPVIKISEHSETRYISWPTVSMATIFLQPNNDPKKQTEVNTSVSFLGLFITPAYLTKNLLKLLAGEKCIVFCCHEILKT
jgi:hypothetical protein